MPKVGLKETLSLLAAGYKKKDIEALAAIDEELEKQEKQEPEQATNPAPAPEKAPEDAAAKESTPEPDYKKMLEEKEKELKEIQDKIKKIQQENVHKDSAPDAEKAKQEQADALTNLVRSYM